MTWFWVVLVAGGICYAIWHLANLPIPDDVEITAPYVLMRVRVKGVAGDETLYSSSRLFIGLRVRLCRRRILNRQTLTRQGKL